MTSIHITILEKCTLDHTMINFDIPNEVSETVANAYKGFMANYKADSYTITLSHEQISELERVLSWYCECLALYNTLGAGRQTTLDILNGVLDILYKPIEEEENK